MFSAHGRNLIICAFFACLLASGGAQALAQTYGPEPAGGQSYGPEPLPEPQYTPKYSQSPVSGVPPALPQPSYGYQPPPQGTAPRAQPPQAAAASAWNTLSRAKQLVRSLHPQEALPLIDWFVREKPLEPEGYFWKGVALDNLNHPDAALAAFQDGIQQVLREGMDSAELRLNAGNELLKLGKVDEAIEQYRRAVVVDPALGLAQLNLGRALIAKGDSSAALDCFQRCDDLHFQPYQLAYYKTKAYLQAGRTEEARGQARMCLNKLPPGDAAERVKREFASLLPPNAVP